MLPFILFFAFIVVPLVELAVIIQVGSIIGVAETIVLLVVDSIVGAVLVKREGRRAWDNFRLAIAEARWPGDEVTQGALILVGGALLLTPGFVTDGVGLLAILPPTRALASRVIRRWVTPGPVREATRFAQDARRSRDDQDGDSRGGSGGRAGGPGESGGPGTRRRTGRDRRGGERRTARGEVLDVEVVSVERDEPPSPREDAEDAPPPGELGVSAGDDEEATPPGDREVGDERRDGSDPT
jgi:UPF0716 protein FxsA